MHICVQIYTLTLTLLIQVNIYKYVYVCVYIFIYIERETNREIERKSLPMQQCLWKTSFQKIILGFV